MSKTIDCIVEFSVPIGTIIPDSLKEFVTGGPAKFRFESGQKYHTYYGIMRGSTCSHSIESLKDAVLEEVGKLNPSYISGICEIEFLNFQDWSEKDK